MIDSSREPKQRWNFDPVRITLLGIHRIDMYTIPYFHSSMIPASDRRAVCVDVVYFVVVCLFDCWLVMMEDNRNEREKERRKLGDHQ